MRLGDFQVGNDNEPRRRHHWQLPRVQVPAMPLEADSKKCNSLHLNDSAAEFIQVIAFLLTRTDVLPQCQCTACFRCGTRALACPSLRVCMSAHHCQRQWHLCQLFRVNFDLAIVWLGHSSSCFYHNRDRCAWPRAAFVRAIIMMIFLGGRWLVLETVTLVP